jgi:hypothetical protein
MNPVQEKIDLYREKRKSLYEKAAESSVELECNRVSMELLTKELLEVEG